MNNLSLYKFIKNSALFCLILIFLNSCGGIFDRKETIDPDARKRARKNVEEGKGISGGGFFGNRGGGTNFEFASSNPLWRASLDTLDFMVIATVDYAGGLIISDWYSDNDPNESVKITLRFLDNEVRVDAIQVSIHKKTCKNNNCSIKKIESDLSYSIKDKILKKAAFYVKKDETNNKRKKVKSVIINEKN